MSDLAVLDAVAQADLVRRGEVTATELVEEAIARIELLNPALNAVIMTSYEDALARAATRPSGRLAGVPYLLNTAMPCSGEMWRSPEPIRSSTRRAKRRYRRRADDLREAIERADLDGDVSASETASLELEALTRELSAAKGLHGRDRRLDDDVERARKTVSARIRDVLSRIAIAHPALGSHLNASVVLAVRCSYQPNEPIRWDLGQPAVG